jgi:hypothetical protein
LGQLRLQNLEVIEGKSSLDDLSLEILEKFIGFVVDVLMVCLLIIGKKLAEILMNML